MYLLLESVAVVEGGALLEGAGCEGGGGHAGALAGVSLETLGLAELLVLLQKLVLVINK